MTLSMTSGLSLVAARIAAEEIRRLPAEALTVGIFRDEAPERVVSIVNEAGLQDLLRAHGSAYEANRAGFYQMQHTITGWPGTPPRAPHPPACGSSRRRPGC